MPSFRDDLADVINRHGRESGSNTPVFILAMYLESCLVAFDVAVTSNADWHKSKPEPVSEHTGVRRDQLHLFGSSKAK